MPFIPDDNTPKHAPSFVPDAAPASTPTQTSQPQSQTSTGPGAGQSFLEHFAQAPAMGYLAQLQAAAAPAIYKGLNVITGNDVHPDSYVEERDRNIARQNKESSEHPWASGTGTLTGIANSALMYPVVGAGGAVAKAAQTGGLYSTLYNPGDTAGQVDPIQAKERAINGVVGTGLGAVGGKISQSLGNAAERSSILDKVKNPEGFGNEVAGKIQDAVDTLNQNVVAPKVKAMDDAIRGKVIPVNLDRLQDASEELGRPGFQRVVDRLKQKAAPEFVTDELGAQVQVPGSKLDMPGNKVLRLRRFLDAASDRAQQKAYETSSPAGNEVTEAVANTLRKNTKAVSPELADQSDELANILRARNAVVKSAKTAPIGTVKTTNLDKASPLATVDKYAGSDLRGLGKNIRTAEDRLGQSGIPGSKAKLLNQLLGLVPRAVDATASAVNPIVNSETETSVPLLRMLLEGKRGTDGGQK